jgi:hypothetical protein
MDGIEALGFGSSGARSSMETSRMTGARLCGAVVLILSLGGDLFMTSMDPTYLMQITPCGLYICICTYQIDFEKRHVKDEEINLLQPLKKTEIRKPT